MSDCGPSEVVAWVVLRERLLLGSALTLACADDIPPAASTDTSGTGASTEAGSSTGPLPSSSTTQTTDGVDGTTVDATGGDSSAGGTSTGGEQFGGVRLRLLLGAGGRLGAGFESLSLVEIADGQRVDTPVARDLGPGRVIAHWSTSNTLAYIAYRTAAGEGRGDDRSFLVGYDDGIVGAPMRIDARPVPSPSLGGNARFTDDDGTVAFFSDDLAGEAPALWFADTADDGSLSPVPLHPPLAAGDTVRNDLAIGPGDAGIAFGGDLTAAGLNNLHLATGTPQTGASVTPLSVHDDPAQAVAFASIQWIPDGSAIVYRADADIDGLNELWWVGLPGGVPTTPRKINDALSPGDSLSAVRIAPDSRSVVYFTGAGTQGEIYMASLQGAAPGPAQVVSTPSPGAAFASGLRYSPSGDALTYTADHNAPGNRDAYYVDLSGDRPATPERINGDLLAGSSVLSVFFGPDDGYLYYVAPQQQAAAELYRVPLLGGIPGVPERISAPLADGGTLTGELTFSPDGSRVLYHATEARGAPFELFMVELGDTPGAVVKINGTLSGAFEVQPAARFSADGSAVVYRIADRLGATFPLLLEDVGDEATNPITLTDFVQGYEVLPTD